MMFASKTPRDLTACGSCGRQFIAGEPDPNCRRWFHEWDRGEHVQHNEPNPILVDYRKHRGDGEVGYTAGWDGYRWRRPSRIEHYLIQIEGAERDPALTEIGLGVKATPAHIIHARKVLQRLANLTKEAA